MKFFVLKRTNTDNGGAVTAFLPVDGMQSAEAPVCETCGKYVDLRPLIPPVRVELECWGDKWGDFAFGPGNQLLISERFKEMAFNRGINGLTSLQPVTVERIRRQRRGMSSNPPQYYLATIARSEAVIDPNASELQREAALYVRSVTWAASLRGFAGSSSSPTPGLAKMYSSRVDYPERLSLQSAFKPCVIQPKSPTLSS